MTATPSAPDAAPGGQDPPLRSPAGTLAPTVVRASAGTGKTYQLTARLLQTLFLGAEPDTLLATTFTRKAAGEILQRLLVALADASDPSSPAALAGLREQVGDPGLGRDDCLRLLRRLVAQIHRLRIGTLDSFFSQLARAMPFELTLPPAWRLTDEIEESWLSERAVDEVIRGLDAAEMSTLLAMLGKGDIRRSVAADLLAVVGEAYAMQRGCGPEVWDRLAVPELPASAEITRAAGHFRQVELRQPSLVKQLRAVADDLEERRFESLPDKTLIANIAKARRLGEPVCFGRSRFPESLDPDFDVLYAIARTQSLSLLRAQNRATGTLLHSYHTQLTRIKEAWRALGFDDIAQRLAGRIDAVARGRDAARGAPAADGRGQDRPPADPAAAAAFIASRLGGAIDHLLLDEFQDTAPIQWQVLRPLAWHAARRQTGDRGPRAAVPTADGGNPGAGPGPGAGGQRRGRGGREPADGSDGGRSFFCVGDTKQAIYGWRGGVAEIFDAVADEIPGIRTLQQDDSFRSSPIVIEFVNRVFGRLTRHPLATSSADAGPDKRRYEAAAIRRFAETFPPHRAKRESLPGYVRLETARAVDGDRGAVRGAVMEDAAARVAEIHRQAPGQTIGVLTRTNRGVGEMIFLLDSRGLTVSQEGGNPLTDSAAVELVLSALMLCEHPGDGRWAFHLARSPLAGPLGITDETPAEVTAGRIRRLIDERGLAAALGQLVSMLGPACDRRDRQRLRQLVRLGMRYEPNATPRVRDFVRLVRDKRVERPQAAPIRVMTVHQAKGLEFDTVVLPELDESLAGRSGGAVADVRRLGDPPAGLSRYVSEKEWHLLPERWQSAFGRRAASAMTEALCLMYVAITRARQQLFMVIAPQRKRDAAPRTAASLIHHALDQPGDITAGGSILYESGNPIREPAVPEESSGG